MDKDDPSTWALITQKLQLNEDPRERSVLWVLREAATSEQEIAAQDLILAFS